MAASAELLVNGTSLGMAGQPPLEIDLAPLPGNAVVADMVYVPLETPLLAAARARGLRTMEGFVLAANTPMLHFARQLGFQVRHDAQDRDTVRVVRNL